MPDPVERLVNLALLVASSRRPVTAEDCRARVADYPEDQDEAAFLRMFERDKEELRAAGLAIVSVREGDAEAYRLDPDATFAPPLSLTAEELAALRAAGAALADDPDFPLGEELRLALLKVLPGLPAGRPGPGGRERAGGGEGALAAELLEAVSARKRVTFAYVNARGERSDREVAPYGLFVYAGGWYLVGRDAAAGEPRVFALARAEGLARNPAAPKHPDFEPPADFDVRAYLRLPFQFGGEPFTALVRASAAVAPRLSALAGSHGSLAEEPGGTLAWEVQAADLDALLRWSVANGPGLRVDEPPEAAARLAEAMREVAGAHGG
ncbi:MAG: WYL domain-containing protein [Coriobacteriia bacterium]|nr:WYL domain-containing protein [Coriobacteriia bacterium]